MTTHSIVDVLASHHFTRTMSPANRTRLAEAAQLFEASPGEYLSREGDPAQAFFLIESGNVEIGTDLDEPRSSAILRVGAGDVVGWSWLMSPYRWEFDARAVNTVNGIRFDAEWLRNQCECDHDLGFQLTKQLLEVVSRRLAATRMHRPEHIH